MSRKILQVSHLSKRYNIGLRRGRYLTLRESLSQKMSSVINKLSRKQITDEERVIWALKDVSFELEEGRILGIIGQNGAGKTTLLKIISRITKPTSGRVILRGRVGSLLEIGTGFHPELTGRENIFLYGAILGMKASEIRYRFDEIVDFSGVERFIDTPVKHYSSGMFVRLAFAVAAHLDTEVLLVDEVLSVGDAEFQKKSMGKMNDITAQGRTILFVSHNMNAIQQLCNACLLLEQGEIKYYDQDVNLVVQRYLFSRPDTLLPKEWINPGMQYESEWLIPKKIALKDHQGNMITSPIRNDMDVCVELGFEVRLLDPALTIGYAVYNEDGICVYWSYHTDGREEEWPKLTIGDNLLRGRIPVRVLNEGIYRIEMIASLHFREWLLEPGKNPPAIFLQIQGGLSDSPLWIMKRPGVIAPVIRWERIDANS
jgi:lipopolysaccharide transport system ATP-binding protein